MSIQSFTIDIPQATLDDLHARLARTRWPDEVEGAGWDYGTNLAYLKELMAYWQHDFDWRKQEAKLNGFAQFRAQIDGVGIHFVHVRGKGPNPLQLLLLHGWHNTNATYPDLTPAEQRYLAASQGWAFQEGPMSLSKPPNRRPWPSG